MDERREEKAQINQCPICGAAFSPPLGRLCEQCEVAWLQSYENARAELATCTAAEDTAFADFVRRRVAERQNGAAR